MVINFLHQIWRALPCNKYHAFVMVIVMVMVMVMVEHDWRAMSMLLYAYIIALLVSSLCKALIIFIVSDTQAEKPCVK
ncbi:hypothetical protein [Colwellia ponticola]|uniref:Uncharacterized protein n=1 Tax=Colwellia ponticola TaxID=2304625 RepID=A0A8H2JK30_9GAMM|nr:hypothetical protein [Colwellia ponticola]TMM43309.1 hypothetical protein FCS21_13105 [Colwellia ponticola]